MGVLRGCDLLKSFRVDGSIGTLQLFSLLATMHSTVVTDGTYSKDRVNAGHCIGDIAHISTSAGHVRFLFMHRRKWNAQLLHMFHILAGQSVGNQSMPYKFWIK